MYIYTDIYILHIYIYICIYTRLFRLASLRLEILLLTKDLSMLWGLGFAIVWWYVCVSTGISNCVFTKRTRICCILIVSSRQTTTKTNSGKVWRVIHTFFLFQTCRFISFPNSRVASDISNCVFTLQSKTFQVIIGPLRHITTKTHHGHKCQTAVLMLAS